MNGDNKKKIVVALASTAVALSLLLSGSPPPADSSTFSYEILNYIKITDPNAQNKITWAVVRVRVVCESCAPNENGSQPEGFGGRILTEDDLLLINQNETNLKKIVAEEQANTQIQLIKQLSELPLKNEQVEDTDQFQPTPEEINQATNQ